ncbi:pseudaminic acid synthase [Desulfovibrio litoralis]|uniref:N-acetylneuraminate synthase n=1 Tax=Desulfovibrio litoralis DSM 11393 TaxID=1121455 RepID=A0A1M7SAR4_9BACT|nr:pseudaminic acid synthase [Desulfovibrio litoralis]SHN55545.1 N-acetylneuraminate synthase [Desulfovibrio litoralis DSM 11393]
MSFKSEIKIGNKLIGKDHPTYIIAEISANHNQDYTRAEALVKAAAECGVDAVKLQTYTADTITIDCNNEYFQLKDNIWAGRSLYDLYQEAYTPWDWQPKLKQFANSLGIDCFSSPFDFSSVDFLEKMNVSAYKVASFELVDFPLLRKIASTGKPIIMSTGMASLAEISDAVEVLQNAGCTELALLKCTSAYPAPPEEANLKTIPHLGQAFGVPSGLSDHTLGTTVPIVAVSLGACIIEKHFTLSRADGGPDAAFSLEANELKGLVQSIRTTEKALGSINYQRTTKEINSTVYRRSLFVVNDMKKGETFSEKNIRSIRPAYGLHTRHLEEVTGKVASKDIKKGTPLSWDLIV